MNRLLKRAFERSNRDAIWITKATKEQDVAGLIRKLRPLPIKTDLIRVGPAGDGGYLIPNDLAGIAACISPGVSTQCGFDRELAERGLEIVMADASVDGPPEQHPRFHFYKKFIDTYSNGLTMTIDEMASLIPAHASDSDLILQLDIEGAEYRVFYNMSERLLTRFRIIAVEFHDLGALFSRPGFSAIAPVFDKILRHHSVVHIHPNKNCKIVRRRGLVIPDLMEFTFYRNDRIGELAARRLTFPHPLDVDNIADGPSMPLPECWYRT